MKIPNVVKGESVEGLILRQISLNMFDKVIEDGEFALEPRAKTDDDEFNDWLFGILSQYYPEEEGS